MPPTRGLPYSRTLTMSAAADGLAAFRGEQDREKRNAALADKYLRPLTSYGQIRYQSKDPKPLTDGSAPPKYMSKELTRVTPPLKGSAVYPDANWKLPG